MPHQPASPSGHRSVPIPRRAALTAGLVLMAFAASAAAQQLFVDPTKRHLPLQSHSTYAVALGDVDGDGDLDLVCGDTDAVRLYRNGGRSAFTDVTAAQLPGATHFARALALGDVDGDGDLDLVCGVPGQCRLYLNSGSGAFTDGTAARMPATAPQQELDLALGDVDGDGDLDIVLTGRLYKNNGQGFFTDVSTSHTPAAFDVRPLALGDLDGDGDPDAVDGRHTYFNNGSGVFTPSGQPPLDHGQRDVTDVELADLDGDGDLDLVCARRTAEGTTSRVVWNDGNGVWSGGVTISPRRRYRSVASGDLDGDGDLDLVFGTEPSRRDALEGGPVLLVNNGASGFWGRRLDGAQFTAAIALGDVGGDGDLDLVCGNVADAPQRTNGQNRLYMNDGAGWMANTSAAPWPDDGFSSTRSMTFGDFDGDGDLDVVCSDSSVEWSDRVYRNEGSGWFVKGPALGDNSAAGTSGDVDADGDLDLLTWGGDQGRIKLYLNNGYGRLIATNTQWPGSADTSALCLRDVDGDNDLDVVVGRGRSDWSIGLLLNDGSGGFTDVTMARMHYLAVGVQHLEYGDVDGDQDVDVLATLMTGQSLLLSNDGNGNFASSATQLSGSSHPQRVGRLVDLDADGDLDIVTGNVGQDSVYLNDGSGVFTDVTATHSPASGGRTDAVEFADVDGDADPDVVFRRGHYLVLWLNDGQGRFTDASQLLPSTQVSCIALQDVDGDGDPDLLLGGGAVKGLYMNVQRQCEAPYLAQVGRTYTLEVYARQRLAGTFDLAMPYLSTERLSVAVPGLGTLGIDPMIGLQPTVVPQPAGMAPIHWVLPNVPGAIGADLYAQALIVSWPVGAALTNVARDVVH